MTIDAFYGDWRAHRGHLINIPWNIHGSTDGGPIRALWQCHLSVTEDNDNRVEVQWNNLWRVSWRVL